MKRFSLFVTGSLASCPHCTFDVKALEEFTVNWDSVVVSHSGGTITTAPPETLPKESGSFALHVKNLQLKFDGSADMPDPFVYGGIPLSGAHFHEELHLNGKRGQASYHFDSPLLKLCGLVDNLPNFAEMQGPMIDARLQQAEQQGPMIAEMGHKCTVDGQAAVGFASPTDVVAFTDPGTHPLLAALHLPRRQMRTVHEVQRMVNPRPSAKEIANFGLKFSGYSNSVGNAFSERACSIESQTASAALLASNPELKAFVQERLDSSRDKVQSLFENDLIKRFNFPTLHSNLSQMMFPETETSADALVETTVMHSRGQNMLLMAGSFALGVAVTLGVVRNSQKKVALADQEAA